MNIHLHLYEKADGTLYYLDMEGWICRKTGSQVEHISQRTLFVETGITDQAAQRAWNAWAGLRLKWGEK